VERLLDPRTKPNVLTPSIFVGRRQFIFRDSDDKKAESRIAIK